MHNVDRGITHWGGGVGKSVHVHDNIISLSSSGDYHIDLTGDVSDHSLVSYNIFDSSSGKAVINWDGVDNQWDLSQFQAREVKGSY